MMYFETTQEGFQELDRRIDGMQEKATEGIIHPENALACVREIRAELFAMREVIRRDFVIVQEDAPDRNGPDAA